MIYFALVSLIIGTLLLALGLVGVVKGAAGLVALAFLLFFVCAGTAIVEPLVRGRLARR